MVVNAVVEEDKIDPKIELPNFKNVTEVIRRNIFAIIDRKITNQRPRELADQILRDVRAVKYKVRPGRSYQRVSIQPIKSWGLKSQQIFVLFISRKELNLLPLS